MQLAQVELQLLHWFGHFEFEEFIYINKPFPQSDTHYEFVKYLEPLQPVQFNGPYPLQVQHVGSQFPQLAVHDKLVLI